MFLFNLIVLTISIGVAICAPGNQEFEKREIQSDGGYPKFPPEEYDSTARSKLSTKEIPLNNRFKRGYSDNVKEFMSVMKEAYSMYQEYQASQSGSSGASEESEEESEEEGRKIKADYSSFDTSQMPEEIQQFWATAMAYYEKFQAEQAASENQSSSETTSSSESSSSSSETSTST